MRLMIQGVEFDGTTNPCAVFSVELDGIQGLFDGVGVRRQQQPRPTAHGDFLSPGYRSARVLMLTGKVFTDSPFDQQHRLTQLAGILADGERAPLTILDEVGSRRLMVELAEGPDVEILVPGKLAKYQITFRAPDPRIYGEVNEFTGSSVQVFHRGSFPASPVVTVTGPRSAPYTITGPGGKQVTVEQALSAGQTHRIDFREGRVRRGNTLQPAALGRAEFFTIPPNQRSTMSISPGSMTVEIPDTYM